MRMCDFVQFSQLRNTEGQSLFNVVTMETNIFTFTLLCLMMSGVGALEVTIPKEKYEFARGDNITLPCTFKPRLSNPPQVIVQWSVDDLEDNGQRKTIVTYYSAGSVTDIKAQYEKRVSVDINVASGKADLRLSSIRLEDNKEFECRVNIPGDDEGKPAATTQLVVLVAPSPPICAIQGKAEYGQNINLTCASEEGSPPPTYEWTSLNARNIPHVKDPRTTSKGGILSLYNITKETSGYYTCTSSNKIRSASCNFTLSVMPRSMNIGSTAGIIVGVVAALLILAIVIYCCCCRKKKEDEEYAMGVREEGYPDKETDRNGERHQAERPVDRHTDDDDHSSVRTPLRDQSEERTERDPGTRRDYDGHSGDRRRGYNDRRSDYDEGGSDYTDRRSDHSDVRDRYGDRYDDDRRSDYSSSHERYNDRHERYADTRRRDVERDRDVHYRDDDRYDEPYDDRERPPVPSDKPRRRDYDD
ncbi:cell surface A33 antigen-like [Dunckerocampus dactyliophorus]|uniref:cell surface A33 antigen-like n=1 Tax=Dunckerocampus dactyliophorus TaxID=161453 RepID=UPI002405D169|nr:cell surface A33 antigen-like [Dunckerocampus dactyliophorus]